MTQAEHAWSIVTPEYPPGAGGVGDYAALVAEGLADAGDRVSVWTPRGASPNGVPRLSVHELPDHFGRRSERALSDAWKRSPEDTVAFVHYVPHGFGWKGMNLPFAAWLGTCPIRLWLMVHEPLYPFMPGQPLKHHVLASATWLMLKLAARNAERLFVSTPAWESFLPRSGSHSAPADWLPIPATVTPRDATGRPPVPKNPRPTVAHFGTYGEHLRGPLSEIFGALLERRPDIELRLVGRGSTEFRAAFSQGRSDADRIVATGPADEETVLSELGSAWVVLFPFVEGATARRTSLMSALAVGSTIVTTEGWCSESIWRASDAVELVPIGRADLAARAVLSLLENETRRRGLSERARKLYDERFRLDHVVERLRLLRG